MGKKGRGRRGDEGRDRRRPREGRRGKEGLEEESQKKRKQESEGKREETRDRETVSLVHVCECDMPHSYK